MVLGMTQTLYIFRGLPASGKSTIAQSMVDKSYGSIVRIERDMLRDQLFYNRYYSVEASGWLMSTDEFQEYMTDRENTITAVQIAMAAAAIISGKSVIISDTNLPAKVVKTWVDVARKHGIVWEIVNFDDVSVETCIQRDKCRTQNQVGEGVIRKMAKAHLVKGKLRNVKIEDKPVLQIEPYVNPHNLPSAVIVDIDGTLAKMANRSPYDWSRVGEDSPVDSVISAVDAAFQSGRRIIVMSGRDGSCRGITHRWLLDHLPEGVMFDLYMRSAGDMRKDDIVKYELFNNHVRDKYHVQYVLDDRRQVVEMWRALGLSCFQVQDGEF